MKSTSPKKIFVVAESIDVEDSSGSKANVALILNLKDAGFEVLVYHYTRKDIHLSGVECVAIKEKKLNPLFLLSRVQRKIQHGLKVNLAKHLEPQFGFSFTFFNDTASIARGIMQLDEFVPDLILTLSKGASFRPHYAMLQVPELHSKWMAYIHDPYPLHYYPEPYSWSEPGYQKKIEFFRDLSEKCKWVAFPSVLLKEWMEKFYPYFKEKSIIIPHQLREEVAEVEMPAYFNPDNFNLLHAGNLMKQRPPFGLLDGFLKFLKKNPEAKEQSRLLLLGSSSFHKEHLEKYRSEEKQVYISNGYVEYGQVLQMQKSTSVNTVLESKAATSPFLPGKFPHCIEAEKPILLLGPEKSESKRLLGIEYPFWSEIDDIERISELIERLYLQWKENSGKLSMKREDLKSYLSVEHLRDEVLRVLQ